jgi:hypothetical protein
MGILGVALALGGAMMARLKITHGRANWVPSSGCWIFTAYGTEGLLKEKYMPRSLTEGTTDSTVRAHFNRWADKAIGVQKETFPIAVER